MMGNIFVHFSLSFPNIKSDWATHGNRFAANSQKIRITYKIRYRQNDADTTQTISEWHISKGKLDSRLRPEKIAKKISCVFVKECENAINTSIPLRWEQERPPNRYAK